MVSRSPEPLPTARRAGLSDPGGQSGVTLIELLVTVFVFTIFLTIVLSSMIGITRASTQAQVVSRSSSGVLAVFQKFDREIRYAKAINFPGTGSTGTRYVEFLIPAESAVGGVATCTQWSFVPSTGKIQSRNWTDAAGSTPSAWATKLESVFDDGAGYPFAMLPANTGGSDMQRLTLSIVAGNATLRGAAISTTFVARNSSVASASNANVNVPGVSDTPVCSANSRRP